MKKKNYTWGVIFLIVLGFLFVIRSPREGFDGAVGDVTGDLAQAATTVFLDSTETVSMTPGGASPSAVSPKRSECDYLRDMVKYLMIVVQMHEAQHEVYKLSNGYAMTFNSPKLEALRKQRGYFIGKIKGDPDELAFFRENLSLPL